ncbi:MAG TPA: DUF4082 domain-containing protein, partial [Thermoanaerobaculia bacterium]|nr:DUF4082 domain-containing protein [Thermoanaerobaculia bacterium]
VDSGPDWKSWIGTLRLAGSSGTAGAGSGYVHLGYHGNRITGLLQFEGRTFRIAGVEAGHLLARISEDRSPVPCGVEDAGAGAPLFGPEAEAVPPAGAAGAPATAAPHRIDVLAVFPRAYFELGPAATADLVRFVRDSISLANDVFVRSNVPASYNLVGVVPLTGPAQPPALIGRALSWLNAQPAEVVSLREAFGADVVPLFVPFTWRAPDACGFAVLPDPAFGSMRDFAFSVNRCGCGLADFTLAHEIGHNYGMRHDDDASEGALFPAGRGNVITLGGQSRATMMGCFCTGCACDRECPLGPAAICNRIPYLSDPQLLVEGVPTGTAGRNNGRVARLQTPLYAAFRAPAANTPPVADFTVSCFRLTCTFDARASSDDSGLTSYWWDLGDGRTASGPTVTHNYRDGGSFPVHLVVTDNGPHGGQKSFKGAMAEPRATVARHQGVLQSATCTAISGWAWDQDLPNTPIEVKVTRDGAPSVQVLADRFRPGLKNAGKGDGRHGFVLPVDPAWKDGAPNVLRVSFENLGSNLAGSPRLLHCGITTLGRRTPTGSRNLGGAVQTVASQWSSSTAGTVTHLGYYRMRGERGAHVGRLWSDSGTLLAQAAFPRLPPNGPAGWVWQALPAPVAVAAGTRYRVSVNTNTVQARTDCGLGTSRVTNHMLTAHGSFTAAGQGGFPAAGSCDNFFVDVKFDPR